MTVTCFNPLDPPFGAKCDGMTDDTAAFLAAYDAAVQNGGGIVLIPATPNGSIVSQLYYSSAVQWVGVGAGGDYGTTTNGPSVQGVGSKLIQRVGTNAPVFERDPQFDSKTFLFNAVFRNFFISCRANRAHNAGGIHLCGIIGAKVRDVEIEEAGAYGIKVEGRSHGGDIQDTLIEGCSINRLQAGAKVIWLQVTDLGGGQVAAPDGTRILNGRYHNSNDNMVLRMDDVPAGRGAFPGGIVFANNSWLCGPRVYGAQGVRDSGADYSDFTAFYLDASNVQITNNRGENFTHGSTYITIPPAANGGHSFSGNTWSQSNAGHYHLHVEDNGRIWKSRFADVIGGGDLDGWYCVTPQPVGSL